MAPTNGKPPEKSMDTQQLQILGVLSFNSVGNKPYDQPEPIDLHRFHSLVKLMVRTFFIAILIDRL